MAEVLAHLKINIPGAITNISKLPAFGVEGVKFKELLAAMSSEDLTNLDEWNSVFDSIHDAVTDSLGNSKVLLPAGLITTLQKNVETLLSDVEERKRLCDLLQVCVKGDRYIIHRFVADYTLHLMRDILQFISQHMKSNLPQCEVTSQAIEFDREDLEAIHYVSGATMRNFYRKSQNFTKDRGWRLIEKVICERFLESDSIPGAPEIAKGWTKSKDRSRLFFC